MEIQAPTEQILQAKTLVEFLVPAVILLALGIVGEFAFFWKEVKHLNEIIANLNNRIITIVQTTVEKNTEAIKEYANSNNLLAERLNQRDEKK